jgi:ribosomal-protein-alanine N-acetyltransferase
MTDRPRLLIRRMLFADLVPVAELERAAHSSPWSEDLIRRELDHDWSTVLLGFEEADGAQHLAGYVIFWQVSDEIHVLNVAVAPEFRRRGYARALLVAAEEQCRQRAVLSTLEVRRSNLPAIGLYASLGYREVGVRRKYYADNNEDALLMTKRFTPVGP